MSRAGLLLVVALTPAALIAAGCGGRGRPPPVPFDNRIIECRVPATVCESGTDMTGACLDPVDRDLAPPLDSDPATCAYLRHDAEAPTSEAQGQAACERLFGRTCADCLAAGGCSACEVEFVAWDGMCPAARAGIMDPGTDPTTPPECPDAGVPDGSADMDADVDAGPGCMEPDAGMPDGGEPISPPLGAHQILSFLYDHPVIDGSPFRTIDLPPDLSPPAGIAPDGLLWAISESGHLVGWDIAPVPPEIVVDVDLASVTPGGTLQISGFELSLPIVGDPPPPPEGPPLPTDPPVDFVDVLVAAREGVFLYRVRVSGVTLITSELRMNVEEAVFHPLPVLEDERYTVFATTMPPHLWLTPALGMRPPNMSGRLSADPSGISLEPVDFGRVWSGLQGPASQEAASFLGVTLVPQQSDPQPRPLVAVGGAEEWLDVVNDTLVVVSATTARTTIRAYAAGNLDGTPTSLEVSGEAVAAETNRLGDTLFAHLVTAGTTSRMRIVRPNAISVTEIGGRDLPGDVEPLDMALGVLDDCDPDGGTCTGFFHVVVRRP